MRRSRILATAVAAVALVGLGASAAAPANAAMGNTSLAEGLGVNGKLDSNWHDYDIVGAAVLTVLKAKPDSAVKVLTDGNTALTAFLPNDRAFQQFVKRLTGKNPSSEKKTVAALLALPNAVDTIEAVLLYHVVPGATIAAKDALKANGVRLTTAQGGSVKVTVRTNAHGMKIISLVDKAPKYANPHVIQVDLNAGNKQIAHGIDAVLLPLDLPCKTNCVQPR